MFDSQHGTGMAAECYRNIDSASVPVWMLMALGIVLVMAGVTVRIVSIRRSDDGTPSLWIQSRSPRAASSRHVLTGASTSGDNDED